MSLPSLNKVITYLLTYLCFNRIKGGYCHLPSVPAPISGKLFSVCVMKTGVFSLMIQDKFPMGECI